MTERQLKNEERIFDTIQELKDSIFGLKQSYISFCYDYTEENGYVLNYEKLHSFSLELSDIAKKVDCYDDSFANILPSFFKLAVIFLHTTCNPSDWIFVSFRKIGKTIYKNQEDEQSTFDIMVENATEYLKDNLFWKEYSLFNNLIKNVNLSDIDLCIKKTIETFIDEYRLNCLDDDELTQNIISKINRISFFITKESAHKSHV